MSKNSAPAPAAPTSTDLAMASAVKSANSDAPPAEPPAETVYPERARVRTVNGGTMLHLHTNTVIDGTEKKIDIDAFAIAQIKAGKWEIVTD